MYYVYILQSIPKPHKRYVGFTHNLVKRLHAHNNGQSYYTKQYYPWRILTYTAFHSEDTARSFEKYLKTSSGIAFMKKRLLPPFFAKATNGSARSHET